MPRLFGNGGYKEETIGRRCGMTVHQHYRLRRKKQLPSKTDNMHSESYYKDGDRWVVIKCPKCNKVNPGNKMHEGVCHYCGWKPEEEVDDDV